MRLLPSESVDAVVCDPPYAISFQGKLWDSFNIEVPAGISVSPDGRINPKAGATGKAHSHGLDARENVNFQRWTEQWAREALRVLKPGGYLLAFSHSRMQHRTASGIEDAGFEIRDSINYMYSQGFPKSRDCLRTDILPAIERQLRSFGVEGDIKWR